eukprot:TRINITY_DN25897_c0_g1_i1.p1 TRINITY_DN25897_c0_g1~~TRINITY_DN25897_c0_g1_i1.p1  ORF type:complete len:108 (+),score=4.29 TRINITY_DN25897_c0_g1_i1:61-384(+)
MLELQFINHLILFSICSTKLRTTSFIHFQPTSLELGYPPSGRDTLHTASYSCLLPESQTLISPFPELPSQFPDPHHLDLSLKGPGPIFRFFRNHPTHPIGSPLSESQ